MSLIISALTCSLSAVLAPQLQEQNAEIPAGIPHPTVPQSIYDWRRLNERDIDLVDINLWHQIDPGVLLGGGWSDSYREARQKRAEKLASLNDWSPLELQDWLSTTAPKPVQVSYTVQQFSSDSSVLLAKGSQPLYPGEPTRLGYSSARPVVADIDVEIAGGSSIADPVMNWMFDGVSLAVAVVPLGDNRWWAETALTMSQPGEVQVIETGNPSIQGKGREGLHVLEFSGPVVLDADKGAVIQIPGLDPGSTVEIQLGLKAQKQPAVFEAGGYLAVDLPTVPLDPGLAALQKNSDAEYVWASPQGLLILVAEGGSMIAEELVASAADVVGANLELKLQSKEGSANSLLKIPGVVGRDYHFASGFAYDVLIDWDAEVASESRIPDPQFRRMFAGMRGTIRATSASEPVDGSFMDVEFSSLRLEESSQYRLGGELLPASDSKRRMGPVHVLIERPVRAVSEFQWDGELTDVRITKLMPPELGYGAAVSLILQVREALDG